MLKQLKVQWICADLCPVCALESGYEHSRMISLTIVVSGKILRWGLFDEASLSGRKSQDSSDFQISRESVCEGLQVRKKA